AAIPWRFWQGRGYLQEAGDWLKQLLEKYKTDNVLRAQALAVYALCVFRRGDLSEAIGIAKQSLQIARIVSNKQTEALSLAVLGISMATQGNITDGIPLVEQS